MKLLAAAGDVRSAIAGIRLHEPLQALAAEDGHEYRRRSFHECTAADLEWADVLVAQRPLSRRAWQVQQRMRRSGGAVVVEIDDLLTEMPPHLLHATAVARRLPWLRASLAAADTVSASTGRLARALAVPRCRVTPNHGAGVPVPPRQRGAGPLSLLFVSSDRVPAQALLPALQALQHRWHVTAVGPVADDLERAGVALQRLAPMPRERFVQWLREQPDAVLVIPLGDSLFDACKSAIKFYDAALAGVPVVAGNRPPYADAIEHGCTGLLVDDGAAAWSAVLQRVIDEPALLDRVARAAQAEVLANHLLAHGVGAWRALLAALPPRERPARPALGTAARGIERLATALRQFNRARLERRR